MLFYLIKQQFCFFAKYPASFRVRFSDPPWSMSSLTKASPLSSSMGTTAPTLSRLEKAERERIAGGGGGGGEGGGGEGEEARGWRRLLMLLLLLLVLLLSLLLLLLLLLMLLPLLLLLSLSLPRLDLPPPCSSSSLIPPAATTPHRHWPSQFGEKKKQKKSSFYCLSLVLLFVSGSNCTGSYVLSLSSLLSLSPSLVKFNQLPQILYAPMHFLLHTSPQNS